MPDPMGGPGAPLGGGGNVKPQGMPGKPPKDKPEPLKDLDKEAFKTLVDDIYRAMHDSKVKADSVEEILDYLLGYNWTENRFLELSKYLNTTIRSLILSIRNSIKKHGVNDTIKKVYRKIEEIQGPSDIPPGAPAPGGPPALGGMPPMGPPPGPVGGPPEGPPGIGASDRSQSRNLTDVDLEIINKRGFKQMSKIIVKEGSVVDSAEYSKEIINNLSSASRKVKASMKKYDDLKMKYAGVLALKKAMDDAMPGGMGGDAAPLPGMGPDEEIGAPAGDGGELSGIKQDLEKIIDDIETIKEEVVGTQEEIGEGALDLDEEVKEGEDAIPGLEGEEADKVESKISEAKAVIKDAKKLAREDVSAFFPFLKKKDKKDDKKDKDEKEDKKDKDDKKDKKDKKEDKDDKEKKSFVDVETVIRRVKARLEELRDEKEANLYPYKKEIKPIPKVDNTNAETAKQQYGKTLDKGTYESDKKYENINPEESYADIPVKNEGTSTKEKKVSIEVAERIRKHSVENAVDQARLSVELASRQQLKGMIDDPLKDSLKRNIIEAGVDAETADAIIHNAYIDSFELSQKAVMKEAFETFMNKEFDEFVKIAKFVDDYTVKADTSSVENVEDIFREKEANESAPLRGFSADKGSSMNFKTYWQNVARESGRPIRERK